MGLMDYLKSQFLEIIQWEDDSRDTISFRYPDMDKEIKRGAQLIVRESQVAQFIYLGQFGDTFGSVLSTNSTQITEAVKNIDSSTQVLKGLLDDLQAGKGLAGNVLRNDQLAEDFRLMADNLAVTSSNLNRLGLWGILWSHKPPRTNTPSAKTLESPKKSF